LSLLLLLLLLLLHTLQLLQQLLGSLDSGGLLAGLGSAGGIGLWLRLLAGWRLLVRKLIGGSVLIIGAGLGRHVAAIGHYLRFGLGWRLGGGDGGSG